MMALPIHRGNPPPSDPEETVEFSRQVLKVFPCEDLEGTRILDENSRTWDIWLRNFDKKYSVSIIL